ncbi:ubiquinone anaerobic biosynthesis protein UbiV [Stappia indica]|uniref:Ubiquinone biosynthesis protein UbiV n=1 Tax=Stappia indica TaxID=538381 RepID=A0A285RV26_9HYPH|nr:U32 family peptidase [Stappia indica]SOB96127.1 Collagenase-like protease, PrtC family [Stappia indica]
MQLTVGPIQGFWDPGQWSAFYERLADTPEISRVVLGELVCSKRLPFYQTRLPDAIAQLLASGKDVALTSLALVTPLKRERRMAAELAAMDLEVEVNDLTMLAHLAPDARFSVGPLVNVYNEGTLAVLARRGAMRVCLPPELSATSIRRIAAATDMPVEVWGWGRLPLAMSGRCYHARYHDRAKDQCQFVCAEDPDGLAVDTLDDQQFLAINGLQTLSGQCANMAHHLPALREAGVAGLRLSPQTSGFFEVIELFAHLTAGRIDAEEFCAKALPHAPGGAFCDGFLDGPTGVSWSGSQDQVRQQSGGTP